MSGVPTLALDTSGDIAVSLVADDASTLAARRSPERRRHAEMLAPMIAEVLAEAGVDRRELGTVVAGTGPAPFTGLRAGLVTARALAFALDVPLHGVCSLDALAAQAVRAGVAEGDVLVVTDARRREVYAARYRVSPEPADPADPVEPVTGPVVDRPVTVAETLAVGAVVVGPAARLYPEAFPDAGGVDGVDGVDPAVLAALAHARTARGLPLPTEPLYLRRPDVTPAAGRKRVTA